jgi:hypothetical protein
MVDRDARNIWRMNRWCRKIAWIGSSLHSVVEDRQMPAWVPRIRGSERTDVATESSNKSNLSSLAAFGLNF